MYFNFYIVLNLYLLYFTVFNLAIIKHNKTNTKKAKYLKLPFC